MVRTAPVASSRCRLWENGMAPPWGGMQYCSALPPYAAMIEAGGVHRCSVLQQ